MVLDGINEQSTLFDNKQEVLIIQVVSNLENDNMQLTFDYADMPRPNNPGKFFYLSDQWIKLRYRVLSKRGNVCECCGHSWSAGNPIQVDHIKPRSKYPKLELEESNLQVLCRSCNSGKLNVDETDWRRAA